MNTTTKTTAINHDGKQLDLSWQMFANIPNVIKPGRSENLVALDTDDQSHVVIQEFGDSLVSLEVTSVGLEQRHRVRIDADLGALPDQPNDDKKEGGKQNSRKPNERIPGGVHTGRPGRSFISATLVHFHLPKAS